MCKILEVSESGYYKWLKCKFKPYKHEHLLVAIKEIRSKFSENENYGTDRLLIALRQKYGYNQSKSTLYRVLRVNDLLIKKKRNSNGITKSDRAAQKSENLINQDFSAQKPNQKWLSDVTEIPCLDGKLYLSAVFDCYDGAIVGLSMDNNMRKELCMESFENACKSCNARGMIFHSDRGKPVQKR